MKYIYHEPLNPKGIWKDKDGNEWKYGEKIGKVFGDVAKKPNIDDSSVIINNNQQLSVEPPKRKIGFFEEITGYLTCSTDDEMGSIRLIRLSLKKLILALLIVVILICGGLYGIYRIAEKPVKDEVIYLELPESMHNTDSSGYSIPDYTTIRKNENNDKTDTWLINVNGNPYDLSYEIYLKDGNELLYQSEILSEGEVIQGMTLYKELSAGEYEYSLICKVYNHGSTEEISVQNFDGMLEIY